MNSLFALLRILGGTNAAMKGPGSYARRKARKAGFRVTRRIFK